MRFLFCIFSVLIFLQNAQAQVLLNNTEKATQAAITPAKFNGVVPELLSIIEARKLLVYENDKSTRYYIRGKGTYIVDFNDISTKDDSVTCILTKNFKRLKIASVSIEAFGAIPNDSIDDSFAIQKAINTKSLHEITLDGFYICNIPIKVKRDSIIIRGKTNTIIRSTGNTILDIIDTGNLANGGYVTDCTIESINFMGNYTNTLVRITNAYNLQIKQCKFSRANIAIDFSPTGFFWHVDVTKNEIVDCGTGIKIRLNSVMQSCPNLFSYLIIRDSRKAIDLEANLASTTFFSCEIARCDTAVICNSTNSQNCTFQNSTFEDNEKGFIIGLNTATNLNVQDCRFLNGEAVQITKGSINIQRCSFSNNIVKLSNLVGDCTLYSNYLYNSTVYYNNNTPINATGIVVIRGDRINTLSLDGINVVYTKSSSNGRAGFTNGVKTISNNYVQAQSVVVCTAASNLHYNTKYIKVLCTIGSFTMYAMKENNEINVDEQGLVNYNVSN